MRAELQGEIDRLRSRGITPGLAAVLVGDNAASATYVRMKGKACDEAELYHETIRLKPETTEAELLELIERLNADHKTTVFWSSCPCRSTSTHSGCCTGCHRAKTWMAFTRRTWGRSRSATRPAFAPRRRTGSSSSSSGARSRPRVSTP